MTVTGIRESTGQAIINPVAADDIVYCNFAQIPEFSTTLDSVYISTSGNISEDTPVVTSMYGFTIDDGTFNPGDERQGSFTIP